MKKKSFLDHIDSDEWDKMSQWWAKVPCPICGHPLEAIPLLNPDFINIGEKNPIVTYHCINPECHAWWDSYCQEWRSFGSSCSTCMVRNMRSNTDYQEFDNRGRDMFRTQVRALESEGNESKPDN